MSTDRPVDLPGSVPPMGASPTPTAQSQSGLFGRGLLYVVVFSLQTVAATVVSPVLAHLIGPSEFGRLASGIALYQLLMAVAVLGLDQALVIQRAEDGHSRSARALLPLSFAVALLVTGVAFATGPFWARIMGFESFSSLLVAILLWTLAGAAVQVMLSLLLAQDRLKVFTLVSALAAVGGQVFGLVLLLVGPNTAATYAWGAVISQGAAMVIALVATRPRWRGAADAQMARRALRLGVPLALGGISTFVLNAGDRIVVQRLLGPAEVGRYQVAYVLGSLAVMLLVFTSQAWTVRFAAIRERPERMKLAEHSRNELYLLLMPMIAGITLVAPFALPILTPPTFRPETLTVVVFLVVLASIPVAAIGASGRELVTLRRGRSVAISTGCAAVLNIALNFALVPAWGIAGSAAATVLAFTLQAVLQVKLVPGPPRWPRTPPSIWVGLSIVCLLCGVSTALPQGPGWNLGRLAVAVGCLPWFVSRLMAARTGVRPRWSRLLRPRTALRPPADPQSPDPQDEENP
ncbi:MAG TPA: oligosaccharide flippase family protein [Propionibacteriaceae bacterium]